MLKVIKVGGSLYGLPRLGLRLRAFLDKIADGEVLLFPGGGPSADVIRALDKSNALGEEASHWLALRMLTVNAYFLAALLPGVPVLPRGQNSDCAILDPHALAVADEQNPGHLPHRWEVTSDSLAVRAAQLHGASELILLKSTPLPIGLEWHEAAMQGLVDPYFPIVLGRSPQMRVSWITATELDA